MCVLRKKKIFGSRALCRDSRVMTSSSGRALAGGETSCSGVGGDEKRRRRNNTKKGKAGEREGATGIGCVAISDA